MSQYLLSTYVVEGQVPGASSTPEEMQTFMERVIALEVEMDASGTFVFGGALHGPDAATVVANDSPWIFGLEPDCMADFLKPFGLTLVADVGNAHYQEKYLQPVGRSLFVTEGERIAHATAA